MNRAPDKGIRGAHEALRMSAIDIERVRALFDRKVRPRLSVTDSGCWEFVGCRDESGYGRVHLFGGQQTLVEYAHRLSLIAAFGPLPRGAIVCHRCDNPPCCNPEHLYAGSQADNARDAIRSGRLRPAILRGIANPAARLTEADVLSIRALPGRYASIAARYGVSYSLVSQIKRRILWGHLQ
jgi:hypothetical protein